MNTQIRKATPEEFSILPHIETLAAQAFVELGLNDISEMPPLPGSFYSGLPSTAIILLAEHKNDIVGFCVTIVLDGQAHLKELSVAYAFSGQGIGKKLLQHMCCEAKTQGHNAITLTTFADISFNAPFYKCLDFAEFTPNTQWPELQNLRAEEKRGALRHHKRIAMIKNL